MKIETCVNINIQLLARLKDAAQTLGLNRSRLIILLLCRIIENHTKSHKMFSRIKYQDRDPLGQWKKIHVRMLPGEYEKALDLRKLLKFSVSAILAFAIDQYLESIVNGIDDEDLQNTDNSMDFYYFKSNFNKLENFFIIYWTPPLTKLL